MSSINKLNQIRKYYSKEGGIPLIRKSSEHYYRRLKLALAKRYVNRRYTELIIDSSELKSKYSSRLWELDDRNQNLRESLVGSKSKSLSSDKVAKILPLARLDEIDINNNPRFRFKDPFVAEVPNTVVTGKHALSFSSDGRVILDTISSALKQEENVKSRVGRQICTDIAHDPGIINAFRQNTSPSADHTLSTACVLHSKWTNYYHWILEHLLKLRGVARYENETGAEVTLIIPPNPPSYVYESLELLGYSNYIEWDSSSIKVPRLIVPSFPEYTPKTLSWIRENMLRDIEVKKDSPKWLYINRQSADKRSVHNYDEVLTVLQDYGISPITCEELSLKEQIGIFSGANGVIGPHGAGLTNILWGTDLSVIELFTETGIGCYFLLSEVLNHEYIGYSGVSATSDQAPQNNDIVVDTDSLREILDDVCLSADNQ